MTKQNLLISDEYIFLNETPSNNIDAITKLATVFTEHNRVKASFIDAVLQRENKSATGLKLADNYAIAIPHADASHVNLSTIGLLTIKPNLNINFGVMGSSNEYVNVQIVFLLAINNPKQQLNLLIKLMNFFQQTANLQQIINSTNKSEVLKLLETELIS